MIPRKKLDVGLSHLLYGMACSFWPGSRGAMQQRLEELWAPNSLACLSVRSGFDVAVEAMELPLGSEVLVSALNLRPMPEILQMHGLVPVPIDLDTSTLAMKRDVLERAVSEKTRAILVAQLLGSRLHLDEIIDFAKKHDLVVIEDSAQAFTGDDYRGHPESDVSMFSFGPIKTCCTTHGGMLRFKDKSILDSAKQIQAKQPIQNRWAFFARCLRYAYLKALSNRISYTVTMRLVYWAGCDNSIVNKQVQSFRGSDPEHFRRQPSYPMLALLKHRLKTFKGESVKKRLAAAETVIKNMPGVRRPAQDAPFHSHWIFPVLSSDPQELVEHLRRKGYDTTAGYSSFVVFDPPEGYEEFYPEEAKHAMDHVVYLPVYGGLSQRELENLGKAVAEFEAAQAEQERPKDLEPEPQVPHVEKVTT